MNLESLFADGSTLDDVIWRMANEELSQRAIASILQIHITEVNDAINRRKASEAATLKIYEGGVRKSFASYKQYAEPKHITQDVQESEYCSEKGRNGRAPITQEERNELYRRRKGERENDPLDKLNPAIWGRIIKDVKRLRVRAAFPTKEQVRTDAGLAGKLIHKRALAYRAGAGE